MKEIVLKSITSENGYHFIRLGNGSVHRFYSIREAKKFLADTNRFLTDAFFNLNQVLIELYSHHRELWMIHDDVVYKDYDINERFDALQHFLSRASGRAGFSMGNYYTFIDLRKFCEFSKQIIKYWQSLKQVEKTDTIRRHKLDQLYDRVNGVHIQLQQYGHKEAFDLVPISKIEHVASVAADTIHLNKPLMEIA